MSQTERYLSEALGGMPDVEVTLTFDPSPPGSLTLEKWMNTKKLFERDVAVLMARDWADGLCICQNCFGDRLWLAAFGRVERRPCLARMEAMGEPLSGDARPFQVEGWSNGR